MTTARRITPHKPLARVPVPPEVRRRLAAYVSRHSTIASAVVALKTSDGTLRDALAPGATIRAETLDRLVETLESIEGENRAEKKVGAL